MRARSARKKNIFSKVYNEIKALRSNIVNSDEIIFLNGLPPFLGSSKKTGKVFNPATGEVKSEVNLAS